MNSSQTTTMAIVGILAIVAIGGGVAYVANRNDDGYNDADIQAAYEIYAEADERGSALSDSERAAMRARFANRVDAARARIGEAEDDGDTERAQALRTELRALLRESREIFPDVTEEATSSSSSSANSSSMSGSSLSTGVTTSAGMSVGTSVPTSAAASLGTNTSATTSASMSL